MKRRHVVLLTCLAVLGLVGAAASLVLRTQLGDVGGLPEAFAAAPGRKLVLVVSPTCPVCAGVLDSLQQQLDADTDADLRVFVVFSRFLRWDRLGVSAATRARLHDGRVTQYWDAGGVVAADLCRAPASTALCATSPKLFGAVLAYAPGAAWRSVPDWQAFDELPGAP
jgi:hypothetical protein